MDALPTPDLSPGWAVASLGDLIDGIEAGKNVAAIGRPPEDGEIGIVKVSAVTWGEFDEDASKALHPGTEIDPADLIRPGDFLISRANTIELVGAPVIVKQFQRRLVLSDKVLRLRVVEGFDRWLELFLKSHFGRMQIEQYATGAQLSMRNISQENLRRIAVPVAPQDERDRIVAAVSALFDEMEAGEAALVRARESLTQFRASLLHAACTGAITADWRAANPTTTTADGGDALPPGWCTMPVSATGRVQLGRQRAPQHHDGPHMRPYLRVANVFEDRIDTTDVMSMNFTPDEFESYRLEPGDILLNEGQSAELVGRPAMFRGDVEDCCFTNTLVRYRAGPLVNRDFALLVFRWWLRTGAFQRIAKITTNIAHLGAGRFGEMLMPIPPLEEQEEIVRRAGDLLGEVNDDALVVGHTPSALRQAILHAAFTGRLVPQDPADEPAAALLARLRAAPAAARRARAGRTTTQPELIETPA